jgi:crotonobetaine/carnitine-CoA ligase
MSMTIGALFAARAETYADKLFLQVPANEARAYHPSGYLCSYGEARTDVDRMVAKIRAAGYGHGHRIAVLAENRPEMLLLKLALAELGISWVPVNPDYRPAEVAY